MSMTVSDLNLKYSITSSTIIGSLVGQRAMLLAVS
jgi:hypothetical protein